jgi:hypothetical protein
LAAIDDVNLQFVNAADKIKMYDGATKSEAGFDAWWAWDIRGWLNRLTWDLLRFQKPANYKDGNVGKPWGLRDSVSRQQLVAEQNLFVLRKLAEANKIDLTGMPGT